MRKNTFIRSTEYQAVDGRKQTTESYVLLMLWRIMQCEEEFKVQENRKGGQDDEVY